MSKKKVVYILGPIDRPADADTYHAADDMLTALGYSTLGPALIPEGLDEAAELRILTAMIDAADAVVELPGWGHDAGLTWLHHLARCFDKPVVAFSPWLVPTNHIKAELGQVPEPVRAALSETWLKYDLEQALGEVSA